MELPEPQKRAQKQMKIFQWLPSGKANQGMYFLEVAKTLTYKVGIHQSMLRKCKDSHRDK